MREIAIFLLLCMSLGCVPQTQPMYSLSRTKRCRALHDRTTTWQIVGAGSAAMSGIGGLTTIPADDKELRASLAIISLTFAAVAAASYVAASGYSSTYDSECGESHD